METDINTIICPHCKGEIKVTEAFGRQLQEQIRKDIENDYESKSEELRNRETQLLSEQLNIQKTKDALQTTIDEAVLAKLSVEKINVENSIRKQIQEATSGQIETLEMELSIRSDQLKDFGKTKAMISQLQREKSELKIQIEAESEEKLNKLLDEERKKIIAFEGGKIKSDLQKRDKLIDDLQKKLTEAQNKLDLGNNKLTGEIKEIELRMFLKQTFPFDNIEDVASGIKGADISQVVINNSGIRCGSILYERKQTQTFSESWITKLKEDGRQAKADILVIVTRALPKDSPETHLRDGVWVSTFEDLPLITTLLRDGLIKQSAALVAQENKGDKMTMLYDYLLSSDFRNHILGILDAFKKMDKAVFKEKEDVLKRIAEREAHIWQAKQSIIGFWGRIEGIASDGLNQQMKLLEEAQEEYHS